MSESGAPKWLRSLRDEIVRYVRAVHPTLDGEDVFLDVLLAARNREPKDLRRYLKAHLLELLAVVLRSDLTQKALLRQATAEADLQRRIRGLPKRLQTIIHLCHAEGLSWAEIGERLGSSAEAARKLYARVVERLGRDRGPDIAGSMARLPPKRPSPQGHHAQPEPSTGPSSFEEWLRQIVERRSRLHDERTQRRRGAM